MHRLTCYPCDYVAGLSRDSNIAEMFVLCVLLVIWNRDLRFDQVLGRIFSQ